MGPASQPTRSDGPDRGASARPLDGRRVLVTRGVDQAAELREALERRGAEVLLVAAIRHDWGCPLEEIAARVRRGGDYTHLVLTSPTAVRFFAEALRRLSLPPGEWATRRIAVVGPGTAAAARKEGLEPEWVAARGAGDLADRLLESGSLEGAATRVLLPQSAIARPELRDRLRRAGARVDVLPLYRTMPIEPGEARPALSRAFSPAPPDAVVFASPSAFEALLRVSIEREIAALRAGACRIVSIGATTSAAIREGGFPVAAEASSPTVEELVAATERALG